jgi:nucleoside 2-deoxyribosyltransferase
VKNSPTGEPLQVFVSGSSSERERSRLFASKVAALGGVVTFPWWESFDLLEGEHRSATPSELEDQSEACLVGVARADLLILLTPTRIHPSQGAWVELGYALALRREKVRRLRHIWVVAEPIEQRFFSLKADRRFESERDCLEALRTIQTESTP